jgi:MFS family permease
MGSVSSTESYLSRTGLADGSKDTELLIGLINALYFIGLVLGALVISPISDKVGRRRAIFCSGIYAMVVIPLFASLQNFGWALVLRFLNGVATGAFDSVGLNWSAEATAPQHRGRVIGIQLCCAALGASQSYFLVYGISKATTSEFLWRFPIAYQCVFVLLVSVLIWILPESARWLVQVGLVNEARDVLLAMQADKGDVGEVGAVVDDEIRSIKSTLRDELLHSSSASYFSMLFRKDRYKTARRTWTALFVQFATQAMVGAGVVSGYGIKIFQSGGWSDDIASLLSGIGIITQAVFGLVGAIYADKIGRRNAFIYGALCGSLLLAFVGLCGHFVAVNRETSPALAKRYSSAVVALVLIWSAQFGMTWRKSYRFHAIIDSCADRSSVGTVYIPLGDLSSTV